MSDARAKAEARRAKILARESSTKVQAIGDDLTLPVDGKPQERPLAKRRSLVKAVSEKSLDESMDASTPQKVAASSVVEDDNDEMPALVEINEPVAEPVKTIEKAKKVEVVNLDDPEVESIAEFEEKHDSPVPSPSPKTTEADGEAKKEMLKKLSPRKTMKEIEEEVARNTAKYDEDTLKGDKVEGKGMKRAKVSKETVMKSKAAAAMTNNIQPANVTRLVRMLVIILLGAYKGYTVVQSNLSAQDSSMIRAMEGNSNNIALAQLNQVDEFGEPVTLSAAEREQYVLQQQQQGTVPKPARTWAQWVQYKVTAPFESTITAVGISYWLANMLSAGINSRLKAPPKAKGILEQIMSLYQSGFEGVLERVFCLLGEYALHLGTILLVATALTLYTEVPTASLASVVQDVAATVAGQAAGLQAEL